MLQAQKHKEAMGVIALSAAAVARLSQATTAPRTASRQQLLWLCFDFVLPSSTRGATSLSRWSLSHRRTGLSVHYQRPTPAPDSCLPTAAAGA